jgi:radical SAM superfamily enzyme YgiQ (UPF0313 family)
MITTKVVIAAVPYVNTPRPLAAPGVLKANLVKHGIDCVALDLNVDAEIKIFQHEHKEKFVRFFKEQIAEAEVIDDITLMIEYCADEILRHCPTVIALSLFCYSCQSFTSWLCAALRQRAPDIKIVIGGPGIQHLVGSMNFDFASALKRKKLIDDFISGDGEISLVKYVQGDLTYPGINSSSWQPVEDLNSLPLPDYSDYQWFKYAQQTVPIIDTRGCVQSCEFCDVIAFWKKFQFLTAENIFAQMMEFKKIHGFVKFDFRSSVSNGNLKEFRKLIKLIADHNGRQDLYSTERITWDGSFIVRPKKSHDEEFWKVLKASNPDRLFVGVETVVERLRIGLGKNFTNEDLDHFLIMTQKYQIPVNLLLMTNYPGETDEEFEQSKQWFRDRVNFKGNSIAGMQLSTTSILPGTKLESRLPAENAQRELDRTAIRKFNELGAVIFQECGFGHLEYNLMDRPDNV